MRVNKGRELVGQRFFLEKVMWDVRKRQRIVLDVNVKNIINDFVERCVSGVDILLLNDGVDNIVD